MENILYVRGEIIKMDIKNILLYLDSIAIDYRFVGDELNKVKAAYEETLKPAEERATGEEATILYGGYEPLTVTLTHILNNKAGIGWTSYSHTGLPVPVYAIGAGAEEFNGFYDNNFFLQT